MHVVNARSGGGAQQRAEVAGVLNRLQHDRDRCELRGQRLRCGRAQHGEDAGRMFDGADVAKDALSEHGTRQVRGALAQGGDFGLCRAGFLQQQMFDGLPRIERGGNQMRAIEQGLPAFLARPRTARQRVPVAHARVLAGADGVAVAHARSPNKSVSGQTSRTGRKLRRWQGKGPRRRRASRCSMVG